MINWLRRLENKEFQQIIVATAKELKRFCKRGARTRGFTSNVWEDAYMEAVMVMWDVFSSSISKHKNCFYLTRGKWIIKNYYKKLSGIRESERKFMSAVEYKLRTHHNFPTTQTMREEAYQKWQQSND